MIAVNATTPGMRYRKSCVTPAATTARAKRTSGHRRESMVRAVERPSRSVAVDHGDVLDAHSEPPGKVYPWLDREGHPRFEGLVIAADQIGMLVAIETDS